MRSSRLSEEMLAAGYAVVEAKSATDETHLANVEKRARIEKRGLWAGTFIAPRDWRAFLSPQSID